MQVIVDSIRSLLKAQLSNKKKHYHRLLNNIADGKNANDPKGKFSDVTYDKN